MIWILFWIMPLVQDHLLDCWPAVQCTTTVPWMARNVVFASYFIYYVNYFVEQDWKVVATDALAMSDDVFIINDCSASVTVILLLYSEVMKSQFWYGSVKGVNGIVNVIMLWPLNMFDPANSWTGCPFSILQQLLNFPQKKWMCYRPQICTVMIYCARN